jgi:hypothetical protein
MVFTAASAALLQLLVRSKPKQAERASERASASERREQRSATQSAGSRLQQLGGEHSNAYRRATQAAKEAGPGGAGAWRAGPWEVTN